MCDVDFCTDGRAEFWHENRPLAAKKHRCSACGSTFGPGVAYLRIAASFDGSMTSYKVCPTCEVDYEEFRSEHTTYLTPNFLGEMFETCVDYAETGEEEARWQGKLDALHERRVGKGAA